MTTPLNSLLSSIGGGQGQAPAPATPSALKIQRQPQVVRNDITQPAGQRRDTPNGIQPLKRKPEDAGEGPKPKVQRIQQEATPSQRTAPATNGESTNRPGAPGSSVPMPYRGTAKAFSAASLSNKPATKPALKPTASIVTPSPTAELVSAAAKPKRGFQAALEKAKAAQEAAKTMGQIKHKAVERLTRRDRQRLQQDALEKQKLAKSGKLPPQQRSRSAEPADPKPGLKSKEQRQREQSNYKGTMKPREVPSYRGTMRTPSSAPPRSRPDDYRSEKGKSSISKHKNAGYASWDDLQDSSLSDQGDGEDYGSDQSSDMEAGLDDVEQEEIRSATLAKKEDVEAAKEEEKLKKEKLERKRKLEQLSMLAARQKKKF